MKILVTGGRGFIGTWAVKQLGHLHEVWAPSRIELDLADSKAVRLFLDAHRFDWTIHCAVAGRNSLTSADPGIVALNLQYFSNLTAAMGDARLINIGSGAEFGIDHDVKCAREDDIWNSTVHESYGLSKNVIARLIAQDPRCYNLRVFGCFGPGEGPQRLIPRLQKCVELNQAMVMRGDRIMDMVYVEDVSTVISHVVNNDVPWRDINVVYAEKTRLSDMLRVYCKLHDVDPGVVRSNGDGYEYTGSAQRLQQLGIDLLGLNKGLELYAPSN